MTMKNTEKLRVNALSGIGPDRLVINPNDAFDLGILTREKTASLRLDAAGPGSDASIRPVIIELSNKCPSKTLQVSLKTWKAIGKPDAVLVLYDDESIFLHATK
jgi:hypothetical protein